VELTNKDAIFSDISLV